MESQEGHNPALEWRGKSVRIPYGTGFCATSSQMCARSQGAESGTFVICLPAESAENENDKELLCCKLHESAKGWMETV